MGMSFLSGIIAARTLGPAGRGEYTVVLLWPTLLAAIGSLGVRESITYHLATGLAAPNKLLGTSLVSAALQSAVLILIGLIVIPLATHAYAGYVTAASLVYLLFIPTNLLAQYSLGMLQGGLYLQSFNIVRLSVSVVYLALLLIFLLTNSVSVVNLTLAMLFANLCTAFLGLLFVVRKLGAHLGVDRRLFGKLYGYGLKNHVGSISSMLNQRADQLIMSLFISPRDLGWYAVAVSVSTIATTAAAPLSAILFPRIATSGLEQQPEIARTYSRANVTASLLLAGAVALITPVAIPLIYGEAYRSSVLLAEILILGALFTALGLAWAASLRGLGMPGLPARAEILALAVTGIGLLVLLPRIGVLGAAITSVVAYLASAVYMFGGLRGALGLNVSDLIRPMAWGSIRLAIRHR